jgi:hypothetical protein
MINRHCPSSTEVARSEPELEVVVSHLAPTDEAPIDQGSGPTQRPLP